MGRGFVEFVVVECGDFQVDRRDLFEPARAGVGRVETHGEVGDGPRGEDIGDTGLRGVEPFADPGDDGGREDRITADREEVVVDADVLARQHGADQVGDAPLAVVAPRIRAFASRRFTSCAALKLIQFISQKPKSSFLKTASFGSALLNCSSRMALRTSAGSTPIQL